MATKETRFGKGIAPEHGFGRWIPRSIGLAVVGYVVIAGAVSSMSSSNEYAGGTLNGAPVATAAASVSNGASIFLGMEPTTEFVDLIQPRECEAGEGIVSACIFL